MSEIIRIGVLCNHSRWEEWEIRVIEEMLLVPGTVLQTVIYPAGEIADAHTFFNKLRNYPYRKLLWNKLRKFWFSSEYFKTQHYSSRLGKVSEISVNVLQSAFNRECIDAEGISKIAAQKPDIIVRFGFNILQGDILTLPRLGIWSFHHADPHEIRGGPLAFWEIYQGFRSCAVVLQRLNEKLDRGEILAYRRFTTSLHSYKEHSARLVQNSISMPAQVLQNMINRVWHPPVFNPLSSQVSRLYRIPDNFQVMMFFLKLFYRRLYFYYDKFFRQEHWTVFYHDIKKNETIEIYNPFADSYFADPFIFEDADGVKFILVENYDRRIGKGCIVKINPTDKASCRILFNPDSLHSAYPYVVKTPQTDYILPDNSDSGRICLYEMADPIFPESHGKQIMNFPGVDPTLFYYEGRWWLWCTLAGTEANSALYLFYSDSFSAPFQAHPCNPIKFDCASSRPAGRPLVIDGKLYRPAQDCSNTYGGDLVWNLVDVITSDAYHEYPVFPPIELPNKGKAAGLHHFDILDGVCVYDIKSYRFSFASFVRNFNALFSKR